VTTLIVEQMGESLVIRLTPEANSALGLRPGDEVHLARSDGGGFSLAPAEMDHQIRLERSRAFLRRFRSSA
jgi:antitoxin component of MazEF toxin-antitoxin module